MSASVLERAVKAVGAEAVAKSLGTDIESLPFLWEAWARPEQLPPPSNWRVWLILSGRGFGKTRTGAEWIRARVESGEARNVIIAGPTAGDVRDVMIEGESGLLRHSPPWFKPLYEPSKLRVTWPNGATAVLLSADEPERFRGKQGDTVWCDELAAWRYAEAWEQLQFTMRLGSPRYLVTTTPRPTKIIKDLIADQRTVVTRGSTYDNSANLAKDFLDDMRRRYEGTRIGRQELFAEVLEDVQGAFWNRKQIESLRISTVGQMRRIVVAIDPAMSANEKSDETGIVVAGIGSCSCKGKPEMHAFVLDDLSGRHTPNEWGQIAVKAYRSRSADRVIGEVNNGGNLIETNLRTVDANVSYKAVRAAQGKRTRAEPVAALYEQGKVHHVGSLPGLEDQMCSWDPMAGDKSPDRVDAMVWALSELMLEHMVPAGATDDRFADY